MLPEIVRPTEISEDRRDELQKFLRSQWERARNGRSWQVDGDYQTWSKAYAGTPLEEIRTVPFYKASNMVVPLIRIFIDTFVARTLNITFATRPLYVLEVLPRELKEAVELYLNKKSVNEWDHYRLCRELLFRGNKNGTAVIKTIYAEDKSYDVTASGPGGMTEKEVIQFAGPRSRVIPFEDFYVYPVTVERLEDAEIVFHKVRYTEEEAKRQKDTLLRLADPEKLDGYLQRPNDVKATSEREEAGVSDSNLRELHVVECALKSDILESGRYYNIVARIEAVSGDLLDLYFRPYPCTLPIFHEYVPFPRESLFYGESLAKVLSQAQEEASSIHNERRDNSRIANSVVFKRRKSSLLPNPSTNWYPGKVFDVEDMEDLDTVQIGRNYVDMIQQEDYTFLLAQKLSGIGEIAQGAAQGGTDRKGVYNTVGTIATMQEGNQRQDTNMRDARLVIGGVGSTALRMQALYGSDDPFIETFSDEVAKQIKAGLAFLQSDKARYIRSEAKASNAGVNKEVERMNLLQMANILGQYGQAVQQLGMMLMNKELNPGIRLLVNDVVNMQSWMAKRLLREFNEWDAVEVLPDVAAAVEAVVQGGSRGTKEAGGGAQASGMELGAPEASSGRLSRPLLENLATMVPGNVAQA